MAELRTFTKDVSCTDYSNAFRYRLRVLENSYTVATNSHNITVIFDILGLRSYYNGYADSDATFRIRASNGTTYNADTNIRGSHSTNYNSYVEIGRWTGDVVGADNGTLTLTPTVTYGWASPSYVPQSSTITGTATATTLPRHSDITYTNPCTMGATNQIKVTEKSASFTHKLYYKTSTGSYTQITGGSKSGLVTTYNWTVPNITTSLPNASSDNYTLKVETYINTTEHIDSEYPLVANVPASVVPSITINSITEGNTAIPSTFPFIVNYSRLKVSTTASGVSGSTVQSRYVQMNNEKRTTTVTTNPVTQTFTAPITQASTTVYAGVTDSRLRTKEVNQVVSGAYAYTKPTVELDVTRSNGNGATNAVGAYVSIKCKWTYDSVSSKNSATIKVYLDGTLKTTYTCSTVSQTAWTQLTVQSASTTTQHTVRVLMEDKLDNAVAEATVSKAVMPISWFDNGTNQGVDFGRMATEGGVHHHLPDTFYSGTAIKYNNNGTVYTRNSLLDLIYPVGSIYLSVNSTNPSTYLGGTWAQIKDRFLLACGDTYSNGATGGEATHTLTTAEMPAHTHPLTLRVQWVNGTGNIQSASNNSYWKDVQTGDSGSTGGGGAHNNMPPYLAVYVWKRTA